ncbi:MAG: molybdopterin dinucleotide binding domain-containing protein, partial [Burkholderiales bacterium]
PFALTTGRLRDHWHGMSRTGTLGRLFGHVAEPSVELNRGDMSRRGIAEGALVRVSSRRGQMVLPAQASESIAAGQAHIAMHWGEEFISGHDAEGRRLLGVNSLTLPTFCPSSKQPELKHSAVRIEVLDLPWQMVGLAWLPQAQALAVREALKPLMGAFGYAVCVPFGREPHDQALAGVLWRAAALTPAGDQLLDQIEALLGLSNPNTLRYQDKRLGQRRAIRIDKDGQTQTLRGVMLVGDTRAEAWIKTLLQDELPAQAYGRLLLSPGAQAPMAVVPKGKQVCTCFNVTEPQIIETLAGCSGSTDERLAQLQGALKCGTNCGSCIPALRGLVKASIAAA